VDACVQALTSATIVKQKLLALWDRMKHHVLMEEQLLEQSFRIIAHANVLMVIQEWTVDKLLHAQQGQMANLARMEGHHLEL